MTGSPAGIPWYAGGLEDVSGTAWYGGGAPGGCMVAAYRAQVMSGRGATKPGGGWDAEKTTPGGTPPFGGPPDGVI